VCVRVTDFLRDILCHFTLHHREREGRGGRMKGKGGVREQKRGWGGIESKCKGESEREGRGGAEARVRDA